MIFHTLVIFVDAWALACLWYVLDSECAELTLAMKMALTAVAIGLCGQLVESVIIAAANTQHHNTYFWAFKDVGSAIFFTIKAHAIHKNKPRFRKSDIALKRRMKDA